MAARAERYCGGELNINVRLIIIVSSQLGLTSEVQIFALNKKLKNMYSNEDLECFYFKYQTEALPHGPIPSVILSEQ